MELHRFVPSKYTGVWNPWIEARGFTIDVAATLGGVTRDMLANWDRTGFLAPSMAAPRRGMPRRYSFRDLVAIRVVAELRTQGITHQALRKVVTYLCARSGLSPKEAIAATNLIADGDDVYEVQGDVPISALRRPGRSMLLMVPLDELVTKLQDQARALLAAA
jgi:DNA-binding transcriptional MerR regulator